MEVRRRWLIICLILCNICSIKSHSPFETFSSTEFILVMRSGEPFFRYTFYGEFWKTIGKFFSDPMVPSFQINSNYFAIL